MSTEVAKTEGAQLPQKKISDMNMKELFSSDQIKQKFQEMLKEKAAGFITSVLQVATNNTLLAKAQPMSLYNAAATAATLDLPINNNLGFAWIVPYRNNKTGLYEAQFQMGWKGFVQLALRTGQYLRINVLEVFENQFTSFNSLTEELIADFAKDGEGKIVGYCAYFKLVNGFEKTVYWSHAKVTAHGKRYSKSFATGPWKDDFDAMAKKTVIKNTLSKWGIMSIEMQKAVRFDHAVVKNHETEDVTYVDVETGEISEPVVNEEAERMIKMISNAKTLESLEAIQKHVKPEQKELFDAKVEELKSK